MNKTKTAIGTPGLTGYGVVGERGVENLRHINILEGESITLKPFSYAYVGGVENGDIRKNIRYPLPSKNGCLLLETKIVTLYPNETYRIVRLPNNSDRLAEYKISLI